MLTQSEYSLLQTVEPLSPSIRFIHKGVVLKKCHNSQNTRQRIIFLFSDQIYIVKRPLKSSNKYKIKQQLPLSFCDFSIIVNSTNSNKRRCGFILTCNNYQKEFFLEKDSELYDWIEKLHSGIFQARMRKKSYDCKMTKYVMPHTEANEIGKQPPKWQLASNASYCNGYRCSVRISGNDSNQTHCASDGLLYCGKCAAHLCLVAYCNEIKSVCHECYSLITGMDIGDAGKRQSDKWRKIMRVGVIKSWLQFKIVDPQNGTEIREKYYCVLNGQDCVLYPYERIEDKFHSFPIKLHNCIVKDGNGAERIITSVVQKGIQIALIAETETESLEWRQNILNLQKKLNKSK